MCDGVHWFDWLRSRDTRPNNMIDGDVWFVAKDVCDVLELTNPTEAIKSLSDNMKMTLEGKESILRITEDANTVRILLISEP